VNNTQRNKPAFPLANVCKKIGKFLHQKQLFNSCCDIRRQKVTVKLV